MESGRSSSSPSARFVVVVVVGVGVGVGVGAESQNGCFRWSQNSGLFRAPRHVRKHNCRKEYVLKGVAAAVVV